MTASHDLIVIGAGPAGGSAALAAARHGLSVALFDDAMAAGGQVYRAPASGLDAPPSRRDADFHAGQVLRDALRQSNVDWKPGRTVWSIAAGFTVSAVGPAGVEDCQAPRLIAATGAHERVVPFPGWTLPGVIGLAAATILLKSQGMVPGRRVVVAGCGPLLIAVAAKIAAAGGQVAAIVDLDGPADWLRALPRLARRPRLLMRGAGWVLDIARARIPIHFRHSIAEAHGSESVETIAICAVDRWGAPATKPAHLLDADMLVVGHGLVPGAEIPRLLGARMVYEWHRGGWIPAVDDVGRTSVAGLFAAGDGAGIRGAEPAALLGKLAGLAAARDAGRLGRGAYEKMTAGVLARLASYRPFANAVGVMMALRPRQVAAIGSSTVVCRCEDITRAGIDAAARDGALDVNQLKHFTRCGMGPCQGRMCGDVAGALLAQARGVPREAVGYWTGRPPLRPVPLEDLIGTFTYGDLPIPKPAPL